MKNALLFIPFFISIFAYDVKAQSIKLHADLNQSVQKIHLDWNMINYKEKTTYVLLRSIDGKAWMPVVTDSRLDLYSDEDIFDYEDKSYKRETKNYYCLKIIDANKNPIAYSNIVMINAETGNSSWVIYSNPVSDVLTLNFKGNGVIKGVVNIFIYDFTGKTVIKFRSASVNRIIQIPVMQLRKGYYIVQIKVLDELMMNQKFLKE